MVAELIGNRSVRFNALKPSSSRGSNAISGSTAIPRPRSTPAFSSSPKRRLCLPDDNGAVCARQQNTVITCSVFSPSLFFRTLLCLFHGLADLLLSPLHGFLSGLNFLLFDRSAGGCGRGGFSTTARKHYAYNRDNY